MKIVLKKPGSSPEVCEVSGLTEINKLVGNVDENGEGYNRTSSDIRMSIGENVDLYVKEDALTRVELGENIWAPGNFAIFFGPVVFAGYDENKDDEYGVCSLTKEQIEYCLSFIAKQDFGNDN